MAFGSDLSARTTERVIVFIIDGLHWQAPTRLQMPVLNSMIQEGTYIMKSHMIVPHHPTVGEYGSFYSCSFPNPMLQEGTLFLRPSNKMLQSMIAPPKQSAFVVNSQAYRSLGEGFTYCIMDNAMTDDEVVSKAVHLLDNRNIQYMRIHLQSPGTIGTEIALYSEGKPYARNIFGPESPYIYAVENCDRLLGELVGYLKESGKWDETVLIITSDHGQSLAGWHPVLDEDSWTTPLVFVGKGIAKGRVLSDFDHIDLTPTIAGLLGINAPNKSGGSGHFVKGILARTPPTKERPRGYCVTIDRQIKEYNLLLSKLTLAAEYDRHLANIVASLSNQNLTPEPFYDPDRILDWYKAESVEHLIYANELVLDKMRKALEESASRDLHATVPASQLAFEQLFGDIARFDPSDVARVLGDTIGKRHYFDRDGDGRSEEVWFVDIEPRHTSDKWPILVKVVDQSGSLDIGKEPLKCGSIWVADHYADGMVDSVINYVDEDGDGDLDRMEWYSYGRRNYRVPVDGIRVLYAIDDGDDNLLDYDINFKYYQIPCQNFSHFGGDERFVAFYLNSDKSRWVPYFENPFLFYDYDKDGITEEVIRVEGHDSVLRTMRWSFNVLPIASKPRDYDVSLSVCGPGWNEEQNMESVFNMVLPEKHTEEFTIMGIPAGPVLKRTDARKYLQKVVWAREMLTWNENNLNIEFETPWNTIERWEGVINPRCDVDGSYMPRIGAPDCGLFNKRFEVLLRPTRPNRYYFNPSDGRVHLKGADYVWMDVDYDYDGVRDMRYEWVDTDGDGVLDVIHIDVDGDGIADDSWSLRTCSARKTKWTYTNLNRVMAPVYEKEPARKYMLIRMLEELLGKLSPTRESDVVWNLINGGFTGIYLSGDVAGRLRNSDKSLLYYLSLVQDRMILELKKSGYANDAFWRSFTRARKRGDTAAMIRILKRYFKDIEPEDSYPDWLHNFRKETERRRVAWNNTWLPPNWGWESDKAAFRFYNGHFDLFGKREWLDTLIFPTMSGVEGEEPDYHVDKGEWGMDILHVGNTSGCGGLILYVNGDAYPVRSGSDKGNPAFSGEVLTESDDMVQLEMKATGVGPEDAPFTVAIRPSAYAGAKYSVVEVLVEGGHPEDEIALGIGLTRLQDETFCPEYASGIMASWGFQDPEIGFMGMGILFPANLFLREDEQMDEHRVVIGCETGVPVRYFIQGDWLRGHQYPVYPSAHDWFDTLKEVHKTVYPDS